MEERTFKLIACEIVKKELEPLISCCKNKVDVTYVTQGLHSVGAVKMAQQLQMELDNVDAAKYDAVLLCYGLCGHGICNLHANLPIVVPRAHDCTTLFIGSKGRYKDYFDRHPGTFYFSSGTLEFDKDAKLFSKQSINTMRQEYVDLYDEETADYLMETLGDPLHEYSRLAFISSGAEDTQAIRSEALRIAEERSWEFDELEGSQCIFEHLLNGDWYEDEFVIVSSGSFIEPTYSDTIIKSVNMQS